MFPLPDPADDRLIKLPWDLLEKYDRLVARGLHPFRPRLIHYGFGPLVSSLEAQAIDRAYQEEMEKLHGPPLVEALGQAKEERGEEEELKG